MEQFSLPSVELKRSKIKHISMAPKTSVKAAGKAQKNISKDVQSTFSKS
jgi:hypothetical protein